MRYTKTAAKLLAAVLALALLAGCGAAPAADAPATGTTVKVSTVDEFLAAIAPDTTIELAEGDYALYTASNYGGRSGSDYYAWARAYDGPMLEIRGVENLVITGAGADKVTLTAEPRYANVLSFVSCRNVTVSQLTAGHTREEGVCSGGVLHFEDCRDCAVRGCGLFGCGTLGVEGVDCTALAVEDTDVYECSYGAFFFTGCRDTRIVGGEVRDCGRRLSGPAMCLLSLQSCDGVTVSALKVHDNVSMRLLESLYSRGVCFVSNEVRGNDLGYMFFFDTFSPTVDGCAFENNGAPRWYAEGSHVLAADAEGRLLDDRALEAMTLREIDPASVASAAAPLPGKEVAPGAELTVTTVDEFLEAIGPERTVVLDGELFDLSAASGYGAVNGQYYYWESTYDGPALVIDGISRLTIRSASDDAKATTLAAAPRYANVLTFRGCEEISLVGFTAGQRAVVIGFLFLFVQGFKLFLDAESMQQDLGLFLAGCLQEFRKVQRKDFDQGVQQLLAGAHPRGISHFQAGILAGPFDDDAVRQLHLDGSRGHAVTVLQFGRAELLAAEGVGDRVQNGSLALAVLTADHGQTVLGGAESDGADLLDVLDFERCDFECVSHFWPPLFAIQFAAQIHISLFGNQIFIPPVAAIFRLAALDAERALRHHGRHHGVHAALLAAETRGK